jgi:hypothetical protein
MNNVTAKFEDSDMNAYSGENDHLFRLMAITQTG